MTDKGRILSFPDTAAIEVEAAAWVARFDAGDVSAKEQAAFQEWLNRSQLHRDCIAEYGSLWSEFDALGQLTKTGKAPVQGGARDHQFGVPHGARPWLAACAAAVIALAGGVGFVPLKAPNVAKPQAHLAVPAVRVALVQPKAPASAQTEPPAKTFYETAIGGQRKLTLADGSSVILNTNSRLEVDFSGNRRDVHLVRGEAYFEVVHDKSRPFTVHANNYVVRDIGTAFDVHLSKSGLVEVGVTKGSVEVTPAHGEDASGVLKSLGILAAGHHMVLGQKLERAEAVSNADLVRELAWRQGDLVYTGQPLEQVLSDISRYSDITVELADPALKNLPVGGTFRIDQIQAILAALENNFGLKAEWTDPQHVRFFSLSGARPAPKS